MVFASPELSWKFHLTSVFVIFCKGVIPHKKPQSLTDAILHDWIFQLFASQDIPIAHDGISISIALSFTVGWIDVVKSIHTAVTLVLSKDTLSILSNFQKLVPAIVIPSHTSRLQQLFIVKLSMLVNVAYLVANITNTSSINTKRCAAVADKSNACAVAHTIHN